eukprot:433224-Pelagomonas_calceolata.AAC.1
MAVMDVQFMKLPGWGRAASYYFITSHTAEYPMRGGRRWSIWVSRAGSDQDSIGAAAGAPGLIRNPGVKEASQHNVHELRNKQKKLVVVLQEEIKNILDTGLL